MSLYKRPNSENWWVKIDHNGERIRRSSGTTDRREAQRFHDEVKASLWKQPKLKGRTWGMAVMKWVDQSERSESDLLSLAKLAKHFPDRLLRDVTRASVDEALSKFCKTPATYTRYRTRIAAILNVAKDEGWITEVPKLAERSAGKKKPRTWITQEQWVRLYKELPPHQRAMAEFSIETGLRQANVLGLTWDRVDLVRRALWIEAKDMKADEAIGVPLNDRAIEILQALQGAHPEFVFTFRGAPIKEIKTAFHAACIRAGLGRVGPGGVYEGFTWHGLRHTWATWHIQNGTPLDVLQKLGGWSDMRMVMNYAHHTTGYLSQFANNTRKKP